MSVVQQKSKSIMDAIYNINSNKDNQSEPGDEQQPGDRGLQFNPSEYSNSFVVGSDPKLSEDHKQELNRK